MTTELYAIYYGMCEELQKAYPKATIKNRVYSHEDTYQIFLSEIWGTTITINILPLGFQVYKTHKDEKLFQFTDPDSIPNTINYVRELLKHRYSWQKK